MARAKKNGGLRAPVDAKSKPWVSNYPPLQDWLDKHHARCLWQIPSNPRDENGDADWAPSAYVESWLVGKGCVILIVHANGNGWEVFSALDSNRITETLADAERRCGVATRPDSLDEQLAASPKAQENAAGWDGALPEPGYQPPAGDEDES